MLSHALYMVSSRGAGGAAKRPTLEMRKLSLREVNTFIPGLGAPKPVLLLKYLQGQVRTRTN